MGWASERGQGTARAGYDDLDLLILLARFYRQTAYRTFITSTTLLFREATTIY